MWEDLLNPQWYDVVIFAAILLLTILLARILKIVLNRYLHSSAKILKTDPTRHAFLRHFAVGLVYMVGISIAIYLIEPLRSIAISIFASAGILAVIIGFAAQQTFSNIISGIFIVIFKPYRIGDRVKLKESLSGVIEDINLRHTIIRNFENKRFVIPNAVISNEIIENSNIGDEKICKWVEFGISYDSDIDKAIKIMQKQAMNHPLFLDNRTPEEKKERMPAVDVRVVGFGDSSVQIRAFIWTKNPRDAWILGTDLNKSIKQAFDKNNIEIPFPYRTIVYKKDLK